MNAKIVLGLGFGDEGKGKTVDYLCRSNYNPIVVRFSGGQQAGHTVFKDNIKHVHSNFGSGTLNGVPSYFSEHTTIYPNSILTEAAKLQLQGVDNPILYVHPLAKVTTPYDLAWNRIKQQYSHHGTCGMGVGATMHRNLTTGHKLFAQDLLYPTITKAKLQGINSYYEQLCKEHNYNYDEFLKLCNIRLSIFNKILEDLPFKVENYDVLNRYATIVFEGSQGIMLDMDHGIFPNVTYANTTSKNALEIIKEHLYLNEVDIYYITRCYQTRHGNGWMSETEEIILQNTEEEINQLNEWQGDFKIREIDYNILNYALDIDNIYSRHISHNKNLVITCIDQRPEFTFNVDKLNTKFNSLLYSDTPKYHMIMGVEWGINR